MKTINVAAKAGVPQQLRPMQKFYMAVKAIVDFVIALVALIVLSPLFLVTAIAIKLDSPGPVFFVQKRIGRGGKEFNCIKFRSMSMEANHHVAGYQYPEVQEHITKVGAFIRKTSIDELPQLFGMLTFKMSLIGYRPSQACETELNQARESLGVLQVRPGITGWAQINGRDLLAANPTHKAEYDAFYVQRLSPWMDLKIFFRTIPVVIKAAGYKEGEEAKHQPRCRKHHKKKAS